MLWLPFAAIMAMDAWLLRKMEWLAQKFQVLTGKTCMWLAINSLSLSIAVTVGRNTFRVFSGNPVLAYLGMFMLGLVCVTVLILMKWPGLEQLEAMANSRLENGWANPLKINPFMMAARSSAVILTLMILFDGTGILPSRNSPFPSIFSAVLAVSALYWMSCDPLPPCGRKVKEWLLGLMPGRVPEPVRVPNR